MSEPLNWIKSSYSGGGGQCVEWAPDHITTTGLIPLRDSKRTDGPVLILSLAAFTDLLTLARNADIG